MTTEGSNVPTGSRPPPRPRPRPTRLPGARPIGLIIGSAAIAVLALAGLSAVADYALRDRTASSPSPPTVTVTGSPNARAQAEGADGQFLSALASYGIADNGTEAIRQRYMEFGHHTCFMLMPPRPQPLDSTVDNILAAENQDVAAGDPWAPKFTRDDAEHLARAAIIAYCPSVEK
jgi:hypothetical protein